MNITYVLENFRIGIQSINTNKYFIGLSMIMLNIGSKFVNIQLSKSAEEYVKLNVTKQLLIFSMAFLGTRCIITSLVLTAVFTILSDHLFNEESKFCIVPYKYRILQKTIDTNNDGNVTESEINSAIIVLEKAKREKQKKEQQNVYTTFHNYINSSVS